MKQINNYVQFGDFVRCKTEEVPQAKKALLEQMGQTIRELAQRDDFWIVKPACTFDEKNPFLPGEPIDGEVTVAWKIAIPQFYTAASDYKERMRREYHELNIRCNKLKDMLERYKAGTLDFTPTCSYELLNEQLQAMEKYRHCLQTRAQIENIALYEVTLTAAPAE